MLTRTGIRSLTHASFYARGLDLYLMDKVRGIHIEESSYVDRVSLRVKGSGSKVYQVSFSYDEATDHISECSCDCPGYQSYDGLCKHLVAGMLKYADRKAAEEGRLDMAARSVVQTEKKITTLDDPKGPVTTPAMKKLLDRRMLYRTAVLTQDDIFGRVQIGPRLVLEEGKAYAELRVGVSHMYVVKDVFEFERNLHTGAEHCYGRKLEFAHMPEAFAPQWRNMITFVQDWVKENGGRYLQSPYYGYPSQAKLRSIPLTGKEMEAFLDAAGDMPVQITADGAELGWCLPAAGVPQRTLRITGKESGIEVEVEEVKGYQGNRYRFCFAEGKIYREAIEETDNIREFRDCMSRIPGGRAYIQKEDVPVFCRDLLPVLEKYYTCIRENFSEQDYHIVPAVFEIYLDAPQEDMITCRVIAVYGERRYNVYGDMHDMGQRDPARELPVGKIVSSYCNAYDEKAMAMVLADDEEKMYEFLTEGIPGFQELGEVYISDALKRIKVTSSPRISVGISLAGDLLELSVVSEDMPREQLLEILNRYDRKKKYYRLKSGEFVNVAGDSLETIWDLKQSLGLTDRQMDQEVLALPRYRAMYLDARLREQEAVQIQKDREFRALVRNMKTVEDNDFEIPPQLVTILREYQKKGFLWLKTLCCNGFGGILADDMGLGKTLQIIAFLQSEFSEAAGANRRCLIVTPASLVYNWYNEIRRFAPGLPAAMIVGSVQEREEALDKAVSHEKIILITSYDLLKRDIEKYKNLQFYCQVIDEAQFIKNHNTQVSRSVKEIQADCKLALTGTPVENRLSELWSIFDYLMPGFLFTYQRFREEIESPIVLQQDETVMERLQKMIRPFVLRRLKKDVLKDLPDKLEEEMYAGMEGEQLMLYNAHVQRLALMLDGQTDEEFKRGKIQILAELTRLRQLCCDPALIYEEYAGTSAKADMCMELVRRAVSGGHKILLFSQFTSMLEILCGRLEEEGITSHTLTGATSKERRRELVEQFNSDDTSVFCISLKAGGTGLNLTAADIVIHYDPWWNLAVQNQATDRAHRIGQKNAVTVYKLVAKDTIEENILRLQEKKRELADQVLAGEGVGTGSFTREELKEIIGM